MTRTQTDDAAALESIVCRLGAEELAHLGSILTTRANERRRVISTAEAQQAFESAVLSEGWQRSRYSDVGRVRAAVRHLVGYQRLHPEQVVPAISDLARNVCPHPLVADEAIACGVGDGLAQREGDETWLTLDQ